jgi:hypothetical protein
MKELTVEQQLDKALNRIMDLEDRLLCLMEVTHFIVTDDRIVRKEITRLHVADYQAFLLIMEYMEMNKKQSVTTHAIGRNVLQEKDYKALNTTLLNLEKFGLIKMECGKKYIDVSIQNPTVFKVQERLNRRRDEKRN